MKIVETLMDNGASNTQRLSKKHYLAPVLTCYGDVRSLTASGSGTMVESVTGAMVMVCDNSAVKSPCVLP